MHNITAMRYDETAQQFWLFAKDNPVEALASHEALILAHQNGASLLDLKDSGAPLPLDAKCVARNAFIFADMGPTLAQKEVDSNE